MGGKGSPVSNPIGRMDTVVGVNADSLDPVQEKLVEMVSVAARYFKKVHDSAPGNETDAAEVQDLAKQYFTLIKDVKQALHSRVQFVTEARPHQRSSYGERRDFDITVAK